MGELKSIRVDGEAQVAEVTRSRQAEYIWQVLDEVDGAAYIRLENSWWGNELFGEWSEALFGKVEFQTDGKDEDSEGAIMLSEGVNAGRPLSKLRRSEQKNTCRGWTGKAVRNDERDAVRDWSSAEDTYEDGFYVSEEFIPKAAVDYFVTGPEATDHYVFEKDGSVRNGGRSDGDVMFDSTVNTEYGEKIKCTGDTHAVFSKGGANVYGDADWDKAHLSFDEDHGWVFDNRLGAVEHVAGLVNDAGFDVVVSRVHRDMFDADPRTEAM